MSARSFYRSAPDVCGEASRPPLSRRGQICHEAAITGQATIIVDKIEALIGRLAPDAICDDCVVDRLGLASADEAQQRSHELAGMRGYERGTCACTLCGCAKLTIRRVKK